MNEEKLSHTLFQTFFVSREISISPMIVDIIKFGKKLEGLKLKDAICSISLAYGKRLLINARDVDVKQMKQQDIVEIADYDTIKTIVLAIGKKNPCNVHAVVEIKSKKMYENCCDYLPVTEKTPCGTIDRAKAVLKTLRDSKNICIKDEGILLVGVHLKEIEDSLVEITRGCK